MERFLGRYSPVVFALFRLIAGLMLACHGGQKLLGMFGGMPMPANTMTNIAGTIELVGGFLVAFGLFGGYAAFLCSGLMAFAYFMVHATGGRSHVTDFTRFFPIINGGESAVLYCWIFLYIACHGSGRYSLDSLLFRRQAVTGVPIAP